VPLLLLSEPSELLFLPFSFPLPLPLPLPHYWGWEQEGEGPPEDTVVPAKVGVEAAAIVEDALLLWA
jgi:hypothetical protein